MGIFNLFSSGKPAAERTNFLGVAAQLSTQFEVLREQFVFGVISGLKSMDIIVPGVSSVLETGSELDSCLKAFQLTCVVGFASRQNYVNIEDFCYYDKIITSRITSNDPITIKRYRERYLDCQGNIDLIAKCVADDIHAMWGNPQPESRYINGLASASINLGILSQAITANVFGDLRTERKLKSLLQVG